MKKISSLIIMSLAFSFSLCAQQATLTIVNKSERELTTKVMQGTEKKSTIHKTLTLAPKTEGKIYFSTTGRYFTKSMAVKFSTDTITQNDTIYTKGAPFEVIADSKRGYSNITMKFTIKESKKPVAEGALPITRKEYEEN